MKNTNDTILRWALIENYPGSVKAWEEGVGGEWNLVSGHPLKYSKVTLSPAKPFLHTSIGPNNDSFRILMSS